VRNSFDLISVNCPLCQSNSYHVLFHTRDYQFKVTDQHYSVCKCNTCGAGFLNPRPPEENIGVFYPEEFYWSLEGSEVERTAANLLKARSKQLQEKFAVIADLPTGKLLDIGTQKGEFLEYMKQQSWSVEGVEFSDTPDQLFDVPIRYGEFLDLHFKSGSYDCITMWAVLEHVYRPAQYVEKISALLKPEATFVGLVTNLQSIQSRWYQKDDYPRHLTIFTKKSLTRLLQKNGFHSIKIWTDQKIFGGPLRGGIVYIFKRLAGYTRDELMLEWHDLEDDIAFSAKFKGKTSFCIRLLSKIDSIILGALEPVFDRLGYGQLLLWKATKGTSQ